MYILKGLHFTSVLQSASNSYHYIFNVIMIIQYDRQVHEVDAI